MGGYGVLNRPLFFCENAGTMPDIPSKEPTSVYAGDTVKWTKSLDDYPADEYTLSYVLHLESSVAASPITFNASADGTYHSVAVAAATTADWAAGEYVWYSYATKASERYSVDSGRLTVKPDPATVAAGTDLRTHARTVLDAIESVLEGRSSRDQEELELDGQKLKRTPIVDLLKLRDRYRIEVINEENADKIAKGLDTGARILTRFT